MTVVASRIEPVVDSIESYLRARRSWFDAQLEDWMKARRESRVREAMSYSLFLSSKRLRPIFCLETAEALSGDSSRALPAAMALELIHTYSLVHDDLPSMDNDDLRRGKPTNHKVFGEAYAILAGDGLQTAAFEVLATAGELSNRARVRAIAELARASGAEGMVLGQAVDLDLEKKANVVVQDLEHLHRLKTGALLASSIVLGAVSVEASDETIESLREFGYLMGLAFQIRDDVLDVIGGADLGKPIGSDDKNQKRTYVSLLGLEQAKRSSEEAFERAMSRLKTIELPYANRLEDLTRFVVDRKV